MLTGGPGERLMSLAATSFSATIQPPRATGKSLRARSYTEIVAGSHQIWHHLMHIEDTMHYRGTAR